MRSELMSDIITQVSDNPDSGFVERSPPSEGVISTRTPQGQTWRAISQGTIGPVPGSSFVLGCPSTFRRFATFVLARAVTYATLFIGLLLVFVPGRILERSGIVRPTQLGAVQFAGIVVGMVGGAIALWCVLTFAFIGRGTPAPFDPPRKLVIRGPYRYVRNPMYIGAALALCGAALFYRSIWLFGYTILFLLVTHVFVVTYEEPTLRRMFGADYEAYRGRVRRWLARRPTAGTPGAS